MVDTVWLMLRGRPVIFLHWYHHVTVMLFCWHSYASRIGGAGLWFATMNYLVHSLMYLYFATQTQRSSPRLRQAVRIYTSPVLTLLQISQMVVGLAVLVSGASASMSGEGCQYLPKSTAVLGIGMYTSYFILFSKLFIEHYFLGQKSFE
eukprot:TRINITY_DN11565_c0_g1_i4.p2 TRINITY_DN11565_c0_g1~~TRINITY_DN11565_c0_g1_i4.p2  ORF type:complete len:149 (+),score=23.34 TRINITY_DN11565_c0_g1_i4:210-656(+)